MVSLGKNIKSLREKLHLNMVDFGRKIGVSDKTVWSWESDRTEPNIEYLIKISEAFNVTIDDLASANPVIPVVIASYNSSAPIKAEIAHIITSILNKTDDEARLQLLKNVLQGFLN